MSTVNNVYVQDNNILQQNSSQCNALRSNATKASAIVCDNTDNNNNNNMYPYQTGCHDGHIGLRLFVPQHHVDGVLLLSLNNNNNNNNAHKQHQTVALMASDLN